MISAATLDKLHRGQCLAARLPPMRSGFNAWIGVYPYKIDPDTGGYCAVDSRPWHFTVRVFELRADFDTDKFDIHDDDVEFHEDGRYHSVVELEHALSKWLSDVSELVEPWKVDYPL